VSGSSSEGAESGVEQTREETRARKRTKDEPSPHLTDLDANVAWLQKEMDERHRKMEQRKINRRLLDQREESKMRDTIFMVQAAVQKVLSDFDTLDDDFERRASSRASSALVRLESREVQREGEEEENQTSLLDLAVSPNWPEGRRVFEKRRNDMSTVMVSQNEQPSEEVQRKARQVLADKTKHDYQNWPRTPKEEKEKARLAEEAKRKHARWTNDRMLGGWHEQTSGHSISADKRPDVSQVTPVEEYQYGSDGSRKLEMGGQRNEISKMNNVLMSEVGIGDPTCSKESREYWKRQREKEQQREMVRAREQGQFAAHARPLDEPHCVYITYELQDQQGRKAFIGQTIGGKRCGKGVLTWVDGSKYSGEWNEDQSNGFGLEKYPNGSFYVGGFKNDARHGYGEFAISPEMSYSGQWEHGQMHGLVYVTELHPDGQDKLIPAQAEKGEVHRRPNKPLSTIAATKQKVEVAVMFAKGACTEAQDLAWSMSVNATQLAKHVIASRSPSPFVGLEFTGRSPIPPIASTTRTVSIADNSDGSGTPSSTFGPTHWESEGKVKKMRPVSAGGVRLIGGSGLPPLPYAPNPTRRNTPLGSRQRPVTAHTTHGSQDSACSEVSGMRPGSAPRRHALQVGPSLSLACFSLTHTHTLTSLTHSGARQAQGL